MPLPDALLGEDSPLRHQTAKFSRKQVLILDGLRYSAEMAHIAYQRLSPLLQEVSTAGQAATVAASAEALHYAWSIVDCAHRFGNLLTNLPGLKHEAWVKLAERRIDDAAALRNCVQHQLGELDGLIAAGGQLLGYLSWVQCADGRPTANWFMLTGGSDFAGDQWFFIGPARLPFTVPADRVRLNAFGRQLYLWRVVAALAVATTRLETAVRDGSLRVVGPPAGERRGSDVVYSGSVEIVRSNNPDGDA
jgi:hypothetical protein